MSVKPLAIDLIRCDGGTQMRAELSVDVYMDYRDKILAGVEFPPLDVFYDGSEYWLADGFHRFYGHREAKKASVKCVVHNGTVRDAILFAVGANAAHGLRRSNPDKHNCVTTLLNDLEWVKWSDRKIAEQAAVSNVMVSSIRKELLEVNSSPAAKTKDEPKIGKDGKARKAPAPKKPKAPSVDFGDRSRAKPEPSPAAVAVEQEPAKISGGPTFDVAEIEAADTGKPVREMFKTLLEHVRQSILLVDKIHNATGRKHGVLHEACINHIDVLSLDVDKWKKAAK